MPKRITEEDLTPFLEAVAQFPDGASIEEISTVLGEEVARRTLQRRLALLVERGQLSITGRKRGSRYRIPLVSGALGLTTEDAKVKISVEVYIPISPEGERIKRAVREPIQNRRPVGYIRDLLDAYRPNETYYLSDETRQRLLSLGHTTDGERTAGTYARQILNRLLIDLSWNSSRLEGNTYSLLETQRLLELGEAADGKEALEAQMILNHKDAIEFLIESAEEIGFNRYTILNLHALLSNNLLADSRASGRLRLIPVGIEGTVYHPLEVSQLIDECFQQILDTAAAINEPFEQAFFVMVHLPYLQPFEDVNKRVSRLAANIPLIKYNLCPLSFVDVPERAYIDAILGVYEMNHIDLLRDVFVWAYERSSARYAAVRQSLGEPDPFRLRYRHLISEIIANIVRKCMDKKTAIAYIKKQAIDNVPDIDRSRMIEVSETELMSLHEGNIARYRLRQSEYVKWADAWR